MGKFLPQYERRSYYNSKGVNVMVRSTSLLLIASIVWLIAGYNIVHIGILMYVNHVTVINVVLSILIFFIFCFMIFNRLVNKHTKRIQLYGTEKQYFWMFFDITSFIIMAVMMVLGITIRMYHLMPNTCIALFYTGLGSALTLAGIKFACNYMRTTLSRRKIHASNR